jgi:hypothetical protein
MLRSVIARRTSSGVARNQWPRSRRSLKCSCRAAATASAVGRSLIGYWAASSSGQLDEFARTYWHELVELEALVTRAEELALAAACY